ncbi:polynucleotide adenylyltransferase PcnB [Litoribrevibacter albus]|uniref:Poly(A) polymerase I n=1 Tax=Litoribrevibacter albus TaxID=1473156 RepID=A0AA37SFE0_9GAMM|nr:polynucleotide adenylyltransferase PcnB [Litoribrevibacter albus]GLQ33663.1 poly(A) polymerase I [Litoribrevibacter albus]
MVFKGIKKRVQHFLNRKTDSTSEHSGPRTIGRDSHPVSRKQISNNALKVLYRLESAGFEAYLVGGCIRDILLDHQPKDFDIATNAHPEQVHKLFRNSRLIGRRFRLVHVHFGREIIEVATFRANHPEDAAPVATIKGQHKSATSNSGMLLRDNVYGTVEEDAARRDFTANALYYSISDFSIHDYGDGMEDITNRTLRMIGEPTVRYQEDPVRMLRAIRFAAKLDFTIETATQAPIQEMGKLLLNIPSARLFDETLKLFQSGHAEQSFRLLREHKLLRFLFPETDELLDQDTSGFVERLILCTCQNTDKRIAEDKPVTPIFLFAAFLWPKVQQRWQEQKEFMPPVPALTKAAQLVLDEQVKITAIPRRFSTAIKEIWDLQLRLQRRNGKKAFQMLEHPRFRAAYDFILLREQAGENLDDLGAWWTDFQSSDDNIKQKMASKAGHPRRGGKRAPGKPSGTNRYKNRSRSRKPKPAQDS